MKLGKKQAIRALLASVGLLALAACEGALGGALEPSDGDERSASTAPETDLSGSDVPGSTFAPLTPCAPILPRRVTRLSDRHISQSVGDLLSIEAPVLETGSLAEAAFLPGKAAAVNASVAVQLRQLAEAAAAKATGQAACSGDQAVCAGAFIDRFAARAFRRPLSGEERGELLALYQAGREIDGNHAGGVSLVVEAVLQAPSFLYLTELGSADKDGSYRLSAHELASKLSLFLTDGLPDERLWAAANSGKLDDEAGLRAEIDRLLALPKVQANLSGAFNRFFDLESLPHVAKDSALPQYSPALIASLYDEATWFVDDVLWKKTGTLRELLTSRRAKLDATAAKLYGMTMPSGSSHAELELPSDQRAGILTRAGLMAVKSHDKESSVVFRGLTVARALLCANPPPPDPAAVALGEQHSKSIPTERGRAEARLELSCKGCHRVFDPVGITFELYGPLGEFRTQIPTAMGNLPVDTEVELAVADLQGPVSDAVELSERLSESRAARECVVQQVAAYALGERLAPKDACTVGELAAHFEGSGGDLRELIKDVAAWPALRTRREGR